MEKGPDRTISDFDSFLGAAVQTLIEEITIKATSCIEEVNRHITRTTFSLPVCHYKEKAANNDEWVFRARMEGMENRPYLAYMRVKDGIAKCTNGHILFRAKTDRAEGFYLSGKKSSFRKIAFPDTSKVSPAFNNFQKIEVKKEDAAYVMLNNGASVNAMYFFLITEGDAYRWEIAFNPESIESPLLLRNTTLQREAVIMPCMVDWDGEFSVA